MHAVQSKQPVIRGRAVTGKYLVWGPEMSRPRLSCILECYSGQADQLCPALYHFLDVFGQSMLSTSLDHLA
jgi:hypothetical protein